MSTITAVAIFSSTYSVGLTVYFFRDKRRWFKAGTAYGVKNYEALKDNYKDAA